MTDLACSDRRSRLLPAVLALLFGSACGPLGLTASRDRLASLSAGHPEEMVRQAAARSLEALNAPGTDPA